MKQLPTIPPIKKIGLPLLGILLVLAGCSKAGSSEPEASGVPILLGAGMISKAAVEEGELFTASVAGWETAEGAEPAYGQACTWLSAASVAASATAGPVALVPSQNYHPQSSIRTCIKAWYPAGTPDSNGQITFGGTPDGNTDVLLAGEISGSAANSEIKTLIFSHMITQIRFEIISTATEHPMNPTLTSITLKNAQLPVGLDLQHDAVRYSAPANLGVDGITPGAVAFDFTENPVGRPVLVRPFDGNSITVDIVTSVGVHRNVQATIDGDSHFVAGKAYLITLTYAGTQSVPLEISVEVAPWNHVTGGDGHIQV